MKLKINSAIHYICKPDWSFERDWDDFTLWFTTAGGCRITGPEKTIETRADSIYLFPPGSYRGGHLPSHEFSVSVVHFNSDPAPDLLPNWEYRSLNPAILSDQMHRLLNRVSLNQMHIAEHWLATILLTLAEDMANLNEETGGHSPHQQRIVDLGHEISKHPENSYRISDMARSCYLSPDHFSRVFKEQMGMTPKAYILHSRIQAAKGLLLSSSYSIEEIAEQCGFQNVFYFSRQFKEKTGMAPSYFRKGL